MELTKLSPELESNLTRIEQRVFTVTNETERTGAIAAIKTAKVVKAQIVEFFKEAKENSYKAWKAVCANEKHFTDRLDDVEKNAKQEVLKYDQQQEELRRKEQARLQAIEDEKARKEQERLLRQAEKVKSPERQEALLEQAQMVAPSVVQVEEQEKTEGLSTRKIWKARVVDVEKVPREWMIVNDKALDSFAKSTKGSVKIPGVEFYQESSLAIKI